MGSGLGENDGKGQVALTKGMNIRKSSKVGGREGVIFNPKIYLADFGPL